jgi:hypothetical protein
MMLIGLAGMACLLALIPALLFHRNLRLYAPPPDAETTDAAAAPAVSVLIPARNEQASIRAAVEHALASEQVRLEVVVLDDHSEDRTAAIVQELAARDARVRLVPAPPLPPGWCGKQHACAALAAQASHALMVFVDADVRLAPQGLARLAAFMRHSGADLVSGVPRQETGTFLERLLIPLIHFLLLGFLPFHRMRSSRHPAYGSGCGQLFMTHRDAYEAAGGHAAIRTSLHDGVTLPRAYRSAGLMTDMCDTTEVAICRMYRSARAVWDGLSKNAIEGLAAPAMIGPATFLLLGGQVMPFALVGFGMVGMLPAAAFGLSGLGIVAAYYPRLRATIRFGQPLREAFMHPVGIIVLLAIQWVAFWRTLMGRPATWKGRDYSGSEANLSAG